MASREDHRSHAAATTAVVAAPTSHKKLKFGGQKSPSQAGFKPATISARPDFGESAPYINRMAQGGRQLPAKASPPVQYPSRPGAGGLMPSANMMIHYSRHGPDPFSHQFYQNGQPPLRAGPQQNQQVNNATRLLTRNDPRNEMAMNSAETELTLKISNIPKAWTTKDCFDLLTKYGNITNIFFFLGGDGKARGEAKVTFRPMPNESFWQKEIRVDSGDGSRTQSLSFRKAANDEFSRRRNEGRTQVVGKQLSIGVMKSQQMLEMFTSREYPRADRVSQGHRSSPITMTINPDFHELIIEFPVHYQDVRPQSSLNRTDVLRVAFTLHQRLQILHSTDPEDHEVVKLAFNSEIVPKCSRKGEEDRFFKDHPYNWNENNSYYRQTDIVLNPASTQFKNQPASVRRSDSIVNLGRWTAYAIKIPTSGNLGNEGKCLDELLNKLRANNVDIRMNCDVELVNGLGLQTIWDHIDRPDDIASSMSALFAQAQPLTFDVRYQLEVCISGGWLNEYDLNQEWLKRLRSMDPLQACALLEHVAVDRPEDRSRRIQDPFSIFNIAASKQSMLALKVPKGKVIIRSATITPTTIIYNTPSIEISNRVIRQYQKHSDRFLRVRFLDERTLGRIYGRSDKSKDDEVFTRIKRVLMNGLTISDRHYDLLAWGNSQFRENGAYFFCSSENGDVTAAKIREWMGDFSDIKVIAKYAARIGQCFSTTRAVTGGTPKLLEIPDVERNGYNFTDGVGKISAFYAGLAGNNFRIVVKADEVPSAYQFRLGGWKGVLAVWPDMKGFNICLRPSQNKFKAFKAELEIIRHSQASEFSLNRQLILVLSALGIGDAVFLDKARLQLQRIHQAMKDPEAAKEVLRSTIDANHITPELADMVSAGFHATSEPFLMSVLHLWRAWSIKYLKEKARINIKQGVVVIGVSDESETLLGHFDALQPKIKSKVLEERVKAVPEIFLQVSNYEGTGTSKVITGLMILARNPSLYAGDIRVVQGVDRKQLHHLKDVVVLPQTGDRDLASMCSGGDVDGDDYLLCWDPELIPPEWNVPAMAFEPPESVKSDQVTMDDLTTFYVRYMKNTELGQIAHHHLAHADKLGVKSSNCVRLAQLHSNAVDYPKTGVPATIPEELRIKSWPHFMEKKKSRSYTSTSALGKLFDSVHREKFEPPYNNPFDKRVLEALPTTPEMEHAAREIKTKYDAALRRLMQQHGIKTEFEVWSTFVLEYNGTIGDYKFAEELGHDVSAIKQTFADLCVEKAGGGRQHDDLAPFVVAMYRVTHQQMADALYECENLRLDQYGNVMEMRDKSPASMPFMSFPWLFSNVMNKIAKVAQAMAGDTAIANVGILNMDDNEDDAAVAKDAKASVNNTTAMYTSADLQAARIVVASGGNPSLAHPQQQLAQLKETPYSRSEADIESSSGSMRKSSVSDGSTSSHGDLTKEETTSSSEVTGSDEEEEDEGESFPMGLSGPSMLDKLNFMSS